MELKIINRGADKWGEVFGLSNSKELELMGSIIFLQWHLDDKGELEALERLAQASNSLEEFITLQKSFYASSISLTTIQLMEKDKSADRLKELAEGLLAHALADLEKL